jgi:signal transduction histidine kinase
MGVERRLRGAETEARTISLGDVEVVSRDRATDSAAELAACRAALRESERRADDAIDDTRRRMARELHDDVGQLLTAIRLGLPELAGCDDADARIAAFARLDALAAVAIESVRTLTFQMRESVGANGDAVAELRGCAIWISEIHGVPCDFRSRLRRLPVDAALASTIRSVARELLVNAARHASATRAIVSLEKDAERLSFTVEDDGVGIDAGPTGPGRRGSGLDIVRERLDEVGGTFRIDPSDGGAHLSVSLPLARTGGAARCR